MTSFILVYLFLASFFTAALSGVIGMAGGITLFSLMTFVMPLKSLIPLHAVVQLGSNMSRFYFLRKHVRWRIFFYYIGGLPWGVLTGVFFWKKNWVPQDLILLLLGLMILWVLYPRKHAFTFELKNRSFFFVGIVVGCLSTLIGALGPFLALFFAKSSYKKEEIVATKASIQMLTHFAKLPAFLYLGFEWKMYINPACWMLSGAIVGTYLGVKILRSIPEKGFFLLFRMALFLAALRVLYKGIKGLAEGGLL